MGSQRHGIPVSKIPRRIIVARSNWLSVVGILWFACMWGCGPDAPVKRTHSPEGESAQRRHNYSAAWIYTIGEVNSLGTTECSKAANLLEGEINCNARTCRYARELGRDYLASCLTGGGSDQISRVKELLSKFEVRSQEPAVDCTEKAIGWITHGCGANGACEEAIRSWATRCANVVKSPLTVQILERVVENSLAEPRRVKIDVHGCEDFTKDLRAGESCARLVECENALPKAEQYMQRCAEGQRHQVPLRDAFSIAHVQLGADREFKPIPLANQKVLIDTVPGLLILSDNSGFVYKVCGDLVADLDSYLELRAKCAKGDVVLLRALPSKEGPLLQMVNVDHESDEMYAVAYPSLFVKGEASQRETRALERLEQTLKSDSTSNLSSWLTALNQAYAALPISLRRSEKVSQLFNQNDASLVAPLRELAEVKLRMVRKRKSELEMAAFIRRALRLPFSDVTLAGAVEWGGTSDLSELALGDELKLAYPAYSEKLVSFQQKTIKTKFRGTEGFAELLSSSNQQGKVCASAGLQISEALTAFDNCAGSEKSCTADERKELWSRLSIARSQWRTARAKEMVLRVSAGSDDRPSAACSHL